MYRLLIADDEALEREGLEWIVSRLMPGMFEVSHAENGRKAIERAAEQRPDIVLMDVKMPGISGLEALKEIRGFLPSVKMVLVTAYDYFEYAREALSLGVREYIVKPAKREQVLETLQRLVQELESEKQRRRPRLCRPRGSARLEREAARTGGPPGGGDAAAHRRRRTAPRPRRPAALLRRGAAGAGPRGRRGARGHLRLARPRRRGGGSGARGRGAPAGRRRCIVAARRRVRGAAGLARARDAERDGAGEAVHRRALLRRSVA